MKGGRLFPRIHSSYILGWQSPRIHSSSVLGWQSPIYEGKRVVRLEIIFKVLAVGKWFLRTSCEKMQQGVADTLRTILRWGKKQPCAYSFAFLSTGGPKDSSVSLGFLAWVRLLWGTRRATFAFLLFSTPFLRAFSPHRHLLKVLKLLENKRKQNLRAPHKLPRHLTNYQEDDSMVIPSDLLSKAAFCLNKGWCTKFLQPPAASSHTCSF